MPTSDPTRAWWPEVQATVGGVFAPPVIEYTREQDICTGIGTLDYTISGNETPPEMWDEINVSVMGALPARYNVLSIEKKIPEGVWLISCQDDSVRLTDYFITEQYEITYPSNSVYWIEKFLNEAGVNYQLPAAYGVVMSENTSLGMTSAYDAIMQLCQMNGWAFYFEVVDNVSTCIIGKFSITENVSGIEIKPNRVIELGYNKSDKMLRNRAVVWGAGNPDTGEWIYADTSTLTPWNRPGNDYRTIVYSNSAIKTFNIAWSLASAILTEFSQTIPEKHITGFYNYDDWWNYDEWRICTDAEILAKGYYLHLMNPVKAYSEKHHMDIRGRITHITENLSKEGGITFTYTIDKRCPRLFGYAEWLDYVYIGTEGAGVWKKWITSSAWTNYSAGITDLNIKDLSAYNGTLGCVTDTGQAYVNHISRGYWYNYAPGSLVNNYAPSGQSTLISSGIQAKASSLDRTYGINGALTFGFSVLPSGYEMPVNPSLLFAPSGNVSWIQEVTIDNVPVYSQQIVVTSGWTEEDVLPLTDFGIVDLETNWEGNNLISVYAAKRYEYIPYVLSGIPGMEFEGICTGSADQYGGSVGVVMLGNHNRAGLQASLPAATSGIFYEVNNYNYNIVASGRLWFDSIDSTYDGSYYLDDNPEKNGTLYTFTTHEGAAIIKTHCVWNPDPDYMWVGETTYYYFSEFPWAEEESDYIANFYKTGNNTFSALYVNGNEIQFKTFLITEPEDPEVDPDGIATVTSSYTTSLDIVGFYITDVVSDGLDYYTQAIFTVGGRFVAFQYPTGISTNVQFKISVLDMLSGSISDTDISEENAPVDNYGAFGSRNQSPNYMYFGLAYWPPITDSMEYAWDIYTILVNKNTGIVTKEKVTPRIYARHNGFFHAYRNDRDTFTDVNFRKRSSFIGVFNENPDSGTGFGLAFCSVYMWDEIEFNVTEFTSHIVILHIDTPLSIEINEYYDRYIGVWGETTMESIESPLWIFGNSSAGGLDGYKPTFSRNISSTPVLFNSWRKSIYELTYYKNVLVQRDLESFSSLQRYPGIPGEYDIWDFSSLMDDIDNSIYITIGTYENDALIAYNTGGGINKIMFVAYNNDGFETTWESLGEGQIAQNKIVRTQEDGFTQIKSVSVYFLYNPLSGYIINEYSKYQILFHNPTIPPSGLFTIIYQGGEPYDLDTALNIPTVFYDKPTGSVIVDSNRLGKSFSNEPDSFDEIYPNAPIQDVRVFDLGNSLYFPISGGMIGSGFLNRYIGAAANDAGLIMYSTEIQGGGFYNPQPYQLILSGSFTHLDFTNTYSDPYMFVCTSGTQTTSGRFFQRNTENPLWYDYTPTLPSGVAITIIRADDRM